jgi:hypothetical protein
VIISREGKLNLLQIVRQSRRGTSRSVAGAAAGGRRRGQGGRRRWRQRRSHSLPIKIGKITLQGGDIRFSDNFIKPNYSANLKKIGGTISGLSSAADSVASLDLRGSYDNIAPLNVSGQLNPLSPTPISICRPTSRGSR